jgi:hypothetical protein
LDQIDKTFLYDSDYNDRESESEIDQIVQMIGSKFEIIKKFHHGFCGFIKELAV